MLIVDDTKPCARARRAARHVRGAQADLHRSARLGPARPRRPLRSRPVRQCACHLSHPDRRHLASARLLPTDEPGILTSLFPDLCHEAPPSGPGVLEITCLSHAPTSLAPKDLDMHVGHPRMPGQDWASERGSHAAAPRQGRMQPQCSDSLGDFNLSRGEVFVPLAICSGSGIVVVETGTTPESDCLPSGSFLFAPKQEHAGLAIVGRQNLPPQFGILRYPFMKGLILPQGLHIEIVELPVVEQYN